MCLTEDCKISICVTYSVGLLIAIFIYKYVFIKLLFKFNSNKYAVFGIYHHKIAIAHLISWLQVLHFLLMKRVESMNMLCSPHTNFGNILLPRYSWNTGCGTTFYCLKHIIIVTIKSSFKLKLSTKNSTSFTQFMKAFTL